MIWLLVPLVAACMAVVCRHVWGLIPLAALVVAPTPLRLVGAADPDRAPAVLGHDDAMALIHIDAWRRAAA